MNFCHLKCKCDTFQRRKTSLISVSICSKGSLMEFHDNREEGVHFDFYLSFYEIFTGRFCGKTLPEPIKSSTQALYVTFHSDELGAFKGFKAEWSLTPETTSAVKGTFHFLYIYEHFTFNFSSGLFLHGKGIKIRKPTR